MVFKAEYTAQVPEFGEVVIESADTEGAAYEEARQLIKDMYPEASDISIDTFEEVTD